MINILAQMGYIETHLQLKDEEKILTYNLWKIMGNFQIDDMIQNIAIVDLGNLHEENISCNNMLIALAAIEGIPT